MQKRPISKLITTKTLWQLQDEILELTFHGETVGFLLPINERTVELVEQYERERAKDVP
jgi:hypothetical protein